MSFQAAPTFTTDLTRATLDAAVRSELGLLPPSSLPARVAAALGVADAIAAIELRHPARPAPPAQSRSAACCSTAPPRATRWPWIACRWVAGEAAAYLRVAARESGLGEPTPIALAGGVMRHPSSLLVDALAAALPGCELVRARREPAHAALLAALDEGGAAPVALDDSALPDDLFATARSSPDEHVARKSPFGRARCGRYAMCDVDIRTNQTRTRRGGVRRVRRDRERGRRRRPVHDSAHGHG